MIVRMPFGKTRKSGRPISAAEKVILQDRQRVKLNASEVYRRLCQPPVDFRWALGTSAPTTHALFGGVPSALAARYNFRRPGSGPPQCEYTKERSFATAFRRDMLSAATTLIA